MVISSEDYDMIVIGLGEAFGKAIRFSNLDATKVSDAEHPDRILVMTPEERDVFLTYVDNIVADITPALIPRLAVTTEDELLEAAGEEGEDGQAVVAIFVKDIITKEGLQIINAALDKAITEGVLAQWQDGVIRFRDIQYKHQRAYENTLKQIANAVAYRVPKNKRIKIHQRF